MPETNVHAQGVHPTRLDSVKWCTRDGDTFCNWCGSMTPEDAYARLLAKSTCEWADFKYGRPHKLYFANPSGKFYSEHLLDAPADIFEPMNLLLLERTGFSFFVRKDTGDLVWMRGDALYRASVLAANEAGTL